MAEPDYTRRPLFFNERAGRGASLWKGSHSNADVPDTAILTEDGIPILTEAGHFILTEH